MIGCVMLGTNDLARAASFYDAPLAASCAGCFRELAGNKPNVCCFG